MVSFQFLKTDFPSPRERENLCGISADLLIIRINSWGKNMIMLIGNYSAKRVIHTATFHKFYKLLLLFVKIADHQLRMLFCGK